MCIIHVHTTEAVHDAQINSVESKIKDAVKQT